MITLPSQADFRALFQQFQRRAWMFETGEHYVWPYEAEQLARFEDGSPIPPSEVDWYRAWLDQIRRSMVEGGELARMVAVE